MHCESLVLLTAAMQPTPASHNFNREKALADGQAREDSFNQIRVQRLLNVDIEVSLYLDLPSKLGRRVRSMR